MKSPVDKYKNKGYTAATKDNLYYHLCLYKKSKFVPLEGSTVTIGRQSTVVSDIPDDEPSNKHSSNDVITSNDIDSSTDSNDVQMKRDSHPKGTRKQVAAETHK